MEQDGGREPFSSSLLILVLSTTPVSVSVLVLLSCEQHSLVITP